MKNLTNKLQNVIDTACEVCGVSVLDFFSKKRHLKKVMARYIIANYMLNKGYSSDYVCEVLGKQRTSIYYIKRAHDNLLQYHKEYKSIYNLFNTKINEN
ncbi:MAG: hypothetical protein K2Q03_03610 [Sphingobacteriaceae bacterium]|nr:hypothetical protein [Sphingobacteriaceae bacterium]